MTWCENSGQGPDLRSTRTSSKRSLLDLIFAPSPATSDADWPQFRESRTECLQVLKELNLNKNLTKSWQLVAQDLIALKITPC